MQENESSRGLTAHEGQAAGQTTAQAIETMINQTETHAGEGPLPRTEPLRFAGSASEYFSIWFVNNVLTILTLGIYSAWAKVRNLRYFYGSTEVAGGAFDFTASPMQILRGRIIACILFAIYIYAEQSQTEIGWYIYVGFLVAYCCLAPLLTVMVMSFQMRYSSWRGINFHFNRDIKGAYKVYFPPLALIFLTLAAFNLPFHSAEVEAFFGIDRAQQEQVISPEMAAEAAAMAEACAEFVDADAADIPPQCQEAPYINGYLFIPAGLLILAFLLGLPFFDFIHQRFLARNVALGTARFSYHAVLKEYYVIYWRWILATLLLLSVWLLQLSGQFKVGGLLLFLLVVASLLYFPLSKAYLTSKRYNLLFGRCEIDEGRFKLRAEVPFGGYAWVLITNSLAVMFSLGLLTPWAKVRSARILLENMAVDVAAPIERFAAQQEEKQNALGEEIADIFNVDLAL